LTKILNFFKIKKSKNFIQLRENMNPKRREKINATNIAFSIIKNKDLFKKFIPNISIM